MSIVGYADLHTHPMAHLGFGGRVGPRALFWGTPTGPIDQALPCCKDAHGPWHSGGGLLPYFIEHEKHGYDGFESFSGWPTSQTTIHQQMYLSSIRAAFDGGLKLLVASAVNTELLTDLYFGRGIDSGDVPAIQRQLAGMRAMVNDNAEWMQIVTSPKGARAAIEQGKLAIILAIEVDSIAGPHMRREGQLDPAAVRPLLLNWWNEGVRLMNPIHLVDNALGGTAIYDDRFNCSNHYLHAKWAQEVETPWFYEAETASGDSADVRFLLGGNNDNALLVQLYNAGYPAYIKHLGRVGHINKRGLSIAGAAFVDEMMNLGMLIDVEHMGAHTLDATIDRASKRKYPLISSHTGFRELAIDRPTGQGAPLHVRGCANESMRSRKQLEAMKELGSIIGIGGHVGIIRDITLDCAAGWARAYKYARDTVGYDSLAIGTDMNGFATAPGPRFEKDPASPTGYRAKSNDLPARPIKYGADAVPIIQRMLQQVALGKRTFDYNTDGLAHFGMLPDFTVDVALHLNDGEESLRAFFNSAEAVIGAWEKCVAASTL